jgi:hypothetical protein
LRTRLPRSGLRALIPFIVAGTLGLAATAASGIQPSSPKPIPDEAFQAVALPSGMARLGEGAPRRGVAAADDPPPIADPWLGPSAPPPERARPSLPATQPIAVAKPTTRYVIRGYASWYCDAGVSPCTVDYPDDGGFDAYGAAGPRLRAAIGSDWRGKVVLVDGIRVKLIDWCQCYQGEPNEKLIDLYRDVFLRTGSPVTIRW